MEPILSKQEIDDLLQAIKNGRVSVDMDDDGPSRQAFLSYTDINLLTISSQRDNQIRIPNFDIILDSFGQNYAISLSNQLQRTFSIVRGGIESFPFQEYLLTKKKPGSIGVINLSPFKHGALIVYDPNLSFNLIEIMLGAAAETEPLKLDRQLTKIELTVLKATMEKACSDLARAFRPICSLEAKIYKIESNPRLVSITEPDAEVLVGSYNITANESTNTMELVFPVAALDPFREEFKNLLTVNTPKQSGWSDLFIHEVQDMPLTVKASSGMIDLTISQILAFQKGDIIPIDYDLNAPLSVLVEDRPKFFAIPGTCNGKKAISITGTRN